MVAATAKKQQQHSSDIKISRSALLDYTTYAFFLLCFVYQIPCFEGYFEAWHAESIFQISYCCIATVSWPTCFPRLLKMHPGHPRPNDLLFLTEYIRAPVTHERTLSALPQQVPEKQTAPHHEHSILRWALPTQLCVYGMDSYTSHSKPLRNYTSDVPSVWSDAAALLRL